MRFVVIEIVVSAIDTIPKFLSELWYAVELERFYFLEITRATLQGSSLIITYEPLILSLFSE